MEQYIPKSALVAEIKARISDIEVSQKAGLIKKRDADKKMLIFKSVLSLIDTIEVKEVDLEKELESFAYTLPHSAIGDGERLGKFDDPKVKEARKHGWSHLWRYNYVKEIAKHFFELGVNASNPLTWRDMAEIYKIASLLEIEWLNSTPWDGIRDWGFYAEVLKRFKDKKHVKQKI